MDSFGDPIRGHQVSSKAAKRAQKEHLLREAEAARPRVPLTEQSSPENATFVDADANMSEDDDALLISVTAHKGKAAASAPSFGSSSAGQLFSFVPEMPLNLCEYMPSSQMSLNISESGHMASVSHTMEAKVAALEVQLARVSADLSNVSINLAGVVDTMASFPAAMKEMLWEMLESRVEPAIVEELTAFSASDQRFCDVTLRLPPKKQAHVVAAAERMAKDSAAVAPLAAQLRNVVERSTPS
ncbi:hypothetical protein H4S07_003508, partial [Coemansia furcata]